MRGNLFRLVRGNTPDWESTVAAQWTNNIHAHDGVDEDNFVALREARLPAPKLLPPSLRVNLRPGSWPPRPLENALREAATGRARRIAREHVLRRLPGPKLMPNRARSKHVWQDACPPPNGMVSHRQRPSP